MSNPLITLRDAGQSVWYDFIKKSLIESGGLAKLIAEDGVQGVTSNPAIFESAIAKSDDYDEALGALDLGNLDAKGVFESLAIADIQAACDVLRDVYKNTKGNDGFVSLEVSPRLADDTAGTLSEARRLWKAVDRPNLMVKVPATEAGIPAIRTLIGEGIHLNVTLLFAKAMYERVVEAYIGGLEDRIAAGGDPGDVRSVASFFISRIDSAVDKALEAKAAAVSADEAACFQSLMGKIAIANAKVTFAGSKSLFGGDRWNAIAAKGGVAQRLLWASTSTKNPTYRDVLYVEELIAPNTVNTVPVATVDAFRDHGEVRMSLEEDLATAERQLAALASVGVSLDDITAQLLDDGVKVFVDAFDRLLESVEGKRRAMLV